MAEALNRRSEQIIKFLLRTGTATIEEILAVAGSSAPSIRRDLARLEEPRTHPPYPRRARRWSSRCSTSLSATIALFWRASSALPRKSAALVWLPPSSSRPNETVGLTAGTTTTHIGRSLRHRDKIQVVTNAINIGMELCNQPGIRTYLTGGVVPWAWSFSLTGNAALTFLDDVYMDKVFLSVTGLDAERGATTLETDEALVYRKMLKQSKQIIVVADSSKLGKVSPAFICPANEIHLLITDTGATTEALAPFERQGIRVIRA